MVVNMFINVAKIFRDLRTRLHLLYFTGQKRTPFSYSLRISKIYEHKTVGRTISIVFMCLSVIDSSLPVWRHILTRESFGWFVQNFAKYKGIQDSLGFWIPRRGFRIPGAGFQSFSVELGFWIPIVRGIPDSLSCILDSKAQEFGFHKQNFPRFRIPQAKISWIPESEFPYMPRKFARDTLIVIRKREAGEKI